MRRVTGFEGYEDLCTLGSDGFRVLRSCVTEGVQ